jgi:hypothetical protein
LLSALLIVLPTIAWADFRFLPATGTTGPRFYFSGTEIIPMPGNPLLINGAPRARSVSAAFLAAFQDHFEDQGKGIFDVIYQQAPIEYFWGLITLAKVMKIELGPPGTFGHTPSSKDEALDRIERIAGPQGRAMLERMLDQIDKAEAKFLAEMANGRSGHAALALSALRPVEAGLCFEQMQRAAVALTARKTSGTIIALPIIPVVRG